MLNDGDDDDDGNDEGAGSCSVIHWKNFPMQSLQILSSAYNLDGNIRNEDCKQFTSSAFASSSMLVKRRIDLFIFTNLPKWYDNLTFGGGLATRGTFNLITSSCLKISPSMYSCGTSKRGETVSINENYQKRIYIF